MMSYVSIILFVIYLIFVLYFKKRTRKKTTWNPFERIRMTSIIKREDGSTFERPFRRFEYVNEEVIDGTVIGIYLAQPTKPKTKKQIKYEKLCEKWR